MSDETLPVNESDEKLNEILQDKTQTTKELDPVSEPAKKTPKPKATKVKTATPKPAKPAKPAKTAKKAPKASANGHSPRKDGKHPKGKTKAAPKAKAKGKAPKSGKARKVTASPRNVGKDGMSCLDAAYKVLKGRSKPMNTKELIEAMAEKKYWTSPGGLTPAATLYTRLIKEIANKGKESRFKKVDKGQFAAK